MRVLQFNNNPGSSFFSNNVNSGVYLLSNSIFDVLKESFNAKSSNHEILYFEHDVLPTLVSRGSLYVYQTEAFWSQVKTAASAVYANRHYLNKARGTSLLAVPAGGEKGRGHRER